MGEEKNALAVLLHGSGVVFLGLVFELAFRLFGKVLIARLLGVVDFGTVALAMTLTGVTATVVTVGLNTGVARFLPRDAAASYRRGVLVSALHVALPVSLLAGGGVFLLADVVAVRAFDAPGAAPVFRAAGVAIPLAMLVKFAVGAVQGNKLTWPKVYVQNLVVPGTRFLFFAAAVLVGFRATGVAWAYALSFGVAAALSVYYLYAYTPLFERVSAVSMHRELLSYSLPVMVRNLMTMVLVHVDTFLLGALATVAAVGVYGAVYPLAMLVTIAHKATNFLYLPIVSELDADTRQDEIANVYQIVAKWLFLATVPIFVAVALFPGVTIGLTYGPEYVAGARALTVLSVGFFVHTVVGVNGGTLEAIGATRFVMGVSVVVAVVNVALNLVLIPRYSLLGAAVATTAAYVLLNTLYTAYLYRLTGLVPFNRRFRGVAAATVVLVGGVYGAKLQFGRSLPVAVALGGAFLACYLGVAARFGLGEEDLDVLADVEEELGVNLGPLRRTLRALTA